MKQGSVALLQDDLVVCVMDKDTASELATLLDSHVAGDVIAYDSPVFNFLRAMASLGLPYRELHRDEELSKQHGYSVVFRDMPEELEDE